MAVLAYGATSFLGGSGFLAVYVAGLLMGNDNFAHKRSLLRFHDGLAWLMQIAMFLTLGLLVFPSRLPAVIGAGLLVSGFLMLVARPISVFLALSFSHLGVREKGMVAWVGLRGAVPIILATFPLVAGLPKAEAIFNLVFFIVLTSALIQGTTIPLLARRLKVEAPLSQQRHSPLELDKTKGINAELVEFIIPYRAAAAGRPLVELELPRESLMTLVCRNDTFLVPSGSTVLEEGDVVQVLVNQENLPFVREILSRQKGMGSP
jgi:cell volume regulation protein A